jgi:hypothetical protein
MLSLYLEKTNPEKSSCLGHWRTTGMYIFRTTNVESEDHRLGYKL